MICTSIDDGSSSRRADAATGRRVAVTNAIGQATHTAYDAEGRVVATWGATYPVAYAYDAFGRMAAMATTRDSALDFEPLAAHLASGQSLESFASFGSLDLTRWLYDTPTGLLTNKLYADSKGTAYSYTPDGKLAARTWARLSPGTGLPLQTLYSYDATHALTAIAYSDATPAVTFTYDRLGRQTTVTQSGMGVPPVLYEYRYDPATLALAEEHFPDGTVLARNHDDLGRPAGLALGSGYAVTYGYDQFGRFHSVSSSVFSAFSAVNYSYLPGSHLISGYSQGDFTRSVFYEPHRDLIAAITNTFDATLISAFDYTNDALGRRTARVDALPALDPVQNVSGYNARSEVQSALMGTNTYAYVFDPIGNRLAATNNAVATVYLANALNQYTNIVEGSAPSTPIYDEDGNMTATGDGWHYAWNGENRLILASNSEHVVTYAYDHQGRMATKTVDGVVRRYLWDGYNIIRETIQNQQSSITNHFVWGLDVSGSLQGAGGIGGLLSVTKSAAGFPPATFFPCFDGNGNVSEYNDTEGMVVAHYEYSPFGELTAQTGDFAEAFTHRFSTKPWCEVTGLVEYELRKYSPGLGRWVNRDPMEERDHQPGRWLICDVYAMLSNDAITSVDLLGLVEVPGGNAPKWPSGPYGTPEATAKIKEIIDYYQKKVDKYLECDKEGKSDPYHRDRIDSGFCGPSSKIIDRLKKAVVLPLWAMSEDEREKLRLLLQTLQAYNDLWCPTKNKLPKPKRADWKEDRCSDCDNPEPGSDSLRIAAIAVFVMLILQKLMESGAPNYAY